MLNIEELKPLIIERLKPLNPDKIILFDIQKKYLLGIDIFVDNTKRMEERIKNVKDQFYDEILTKGIKIYG